MLFCTIYRIKTPVYIENEERLYEKTYKITIIINKHTLFIRKNVQKQANRSASFDIGAPKWIRGLNK